MLALVTAHRTSVSSEPAQSVDVKQSKDGAVMMNRQTVVTRDKKPVDRAEL
jgi:hypothetical protein